MTRLSKDVENWTTSLLWEVEGCRFTAYRDGRDGAGRWTIGIGHLLDQEKDWTGYTCTAKQADDWHEEDMREAWESIDALVKVPLTAGQQAALLSWTFNLGHARLAESDLLKHLNAGNYDLAENEWPKWRRSAGNIEAGLVWRRAAERVLWRGEGIAEALRVYRKRDREELTKWA